MLLPRLLDFAARFVGDHDAEDVVHSALSEIWERWPLVQMDRPSIAFFFRAVRNRIANFRRSDHRERVRLATYLSAAARRSRRDAMPDAALERAEREALVEATVAAMPERCREAWVLVEQNDLSYYRAAEAMEISPAGVRKNVRRGLHLVREALQAGGYYEPRHDQKRLPPPAGPEEER